MNLLEEIGGAEISYWQKTWGRATLAKEMGGQRDTAADQTWRVRQKEIVPLQKKKHLIE